jgi:hypothetical protein
MLPLKGIRRSAFIFFLGATFMFLIMRAWQGSSSPNTTAVPVVDDVGQGGRRVLFYNVGWRGGPITLATEDSPYKPRGQHIILDVHDSDSAFLNDMEAMTTEFRALLQDAGMHIL